jgi:hypothetical protein
MNFLVKILNNNPTESLPLVVDQSINISVYPLAIISLSFAIAIVVALHGSQGHGIKEELKRRDAK